MFVLKIWLPDGQSFTLVTGVMSFTFDATQEEHAELVVDSVHYDGPLVYPLLDGCKFSIVHEAVYDEELVVSKKHTSEEITEHLRKACEGEHVQVTDGFGNQGEMKIGGTD